MSLIREKSARAGQRSQEMFQKQVDKQFKAFVIKPTQAN